MAILTRRPSTWDVNDRLGFLRVAARPGQRALGRVIAGTTSLPCALGPAGIVRAKREGDGATPAGVYRLLSVLFRPDRLARPITRLPVRPVRGDDGWCDDARCSRYNRPVRLPFAAGHEALWRGDGLYDCVVVIDYNTRHPRKAHGSAIFLHVAAPGYTPTAGCVAVARPALIRLLRRVTPATRIVIGDVPIRREPAPWGGSPAGSGRWPRATPASRGFARWPARP